jgi:hypothetical protein
MDRRGSRRFRSRAAFGFLQMAAIEAKYSAGCLRSAMARGSLPLVVRSWGMAPIAAAEYDR